MTFGTIGLNRKRTGLEMFRKSFLVLKIDDFLSVEPDLDMSTDGFDTEGVPLFRFSELVYGVALVKPVVEVKPDWFTGGSTTNIHLKMVPFLSGLVTKIDPAVVFSVFVDLKFKAEIKVLKTGL